MPGEQRTERGVRFAIGRLESDRRVRGRARSGGISKPLAHERERDERENGDSAARRELQRRFAIGHCAGKLTQFVVGARAIDVQHGVAGIER